MKILTIILSLLIPMLVVAKNYPVMEGVDMQKLQEMQSCMEKVDQEKLKFIEQRQHQFNAEVKELCDSGKRHEAQKKAILFSKEMMNNPTIQAVSMCGEMAKGMMPSMSFIEHNDKFSNHHVCDSNL